MKQLAFIGFGLRSRTMLKAFHGIGADIEICGIADPNTEAVSNQIQSDSFCKSTKLYSTAEDLLKNHQPDGIFIGTRCNLHTKYACIALQYPAAVFLEKPVCISWEQYQTFLSTTQQQRNRTLVSFPLRFTSIVQYIKKIVDQGTLGDIISVQAINNVPYGDVYYHSWYRDSQLTGGLFLQKATHDMDYIHFILGKRPTSVVAKTSTVYFKGDKPKDLQCPFCEEYTTCPESSFVNQYQYKKEPSGDFCCFSKETTNEDIGAAIFACDDGTIISYHQTFFVKNSAGRRGARFIGTKASLEFDFYTAKVQIDYYNQDHHAIHQFYYPENLVHFGGDEALAREFLSVMQGCSSQANLEQGLASAAMCLAAKQSAETNKEIIIPYQF